MFEKLTPQMAAEMRAKTIERYRCSGSVALGVSTGYLWTNRFATSRSSPPFEQKQPTDERGRAMYAAGRSILRAELDRLTQEDLERGLTPVRRDPNPHPGSIAHPKDG